MGFSPGLRLRFVARRFGIENRRIRRDAGNECNHSLSRMVELRRAERGLLANPRRPASTSEGKDKQSHQHDVERAQREHGDVKDAGQADHGVPPIHANRVV
jgi:hypothetical protein